MGLVVVRELSQRGIVTVFMNDKGEAELCPFEEMELDLMTEAQALDILLERNCSDEELMAYTMGRQAREARRRG